MVFQTGTISHGTHRPQDLLESFSEAYKQHCEDSGFDHALYEMAKTVAADLNQPDPSMGLYEIAGGVLDDLIDNLEEIAAKHNCYFGATEGDGSDFGFWPNEGGEADMYEGPFPV